MATHSSILAWKIPWTEAPGGSLHGGGKESDMTDSIAQHMRSEIVRSICRLYFTMFPLKRHFTSSLFLYVSAKLCQLCPTLCDPVDCSLPGFSAHGHSPGKNTEWVAMPSSRGSSRPGD